MPHSIRVKWGAAEGKHRFWEDVSSVVQVHTQKMCLKAQSFSY